MTSHKMPVSIVVMGPSGVGKTTTAELLAKTFGWRFAEADEFHPPENIEKMSKGVPLDDEDRAPWLEKIRDWISAEAEAGRDTVLTCSALKRRYRDVLRTAKAEVKFLALVADEGLVASRLEKRTGHYMPSSLLASQFAALEVLSPDEPGMKVTVDVAPEAVVDRAISGLKLKRP